MEDDGRPPGSDAPPLDDGLAALPLADLVEVVAEATPDVVDEAVRRWAAARPAGQVAAEVLRALAVGGGADPERGDHLVAALAAADDAEVVASTMARLGADAGPGCGAAWLWLVDHGSGPGEVFSRPAPIVAEALGAALRRGAWALDAGRSAAGLDLAGAVGAAAAPMVDWLRAAGDERVQRDVVDALGRTHTPAAEAVLGALVQARPTAALARAARRAR